MADGFISRLGNLWKGFMSLWISGIEKEHPEIAYENAINAMVTKYSQLKKATAAIIRRREDVTARMEKASVSPRPLAGEEQLQAKQERG
jgi:phage shock protein A